MLEGVTVLDFTTLLPGPYASSRLAELGATIWKVEPPGGDPARHMHPQKKGTGIVFLVHSQNKTLLEINLKTEDGQKTVRNFIDRVDVLLEGFRPGVPERLGIGYEQLNKINPRLIYCALTGYGQSSRLAHAAGHDINYMALSGMLAQHLDSQENPILPSVQWADLIGGQGAVEAILAALVERHRTNQGRFLDISIFAQLQRLLKVHTAIWQATGFSRGVPQLTGAVVCYHLYQTSDSRFVALGALETKFWDNFCRALGNPQWIPHQFSRADPENSVYREIRDVFSIKTLAYWSDFGHEADYCLTPVLSLPESCSDIFSPD
ncbi:MAG: CoA transferase [Firmicutes bacterium]|jgi:crotonobetainyl-CoA:carnitine CoA-transferase CaiB-like acyl-CoA transferase|uniref:CoA transferase n=1 Tax=Sulfobacillus benefaciens TaxID=453960 RepID=A0A2T2WWK8_9FIRM|nr:CoA transferase [Bacillota bacterium]MCL5012774.1 CoA transferase [Bacillota bacterium]PSR26616.1 MAG: CoA transferase [Sulfobacillus benefaciens]